MYALSKCPFKNVAPSRIAEAAHPHNAGCGRFGSAAAIAIGKLVPKLKVTHAVLHLLGYINQGFKISPACLFDERCIKHSEPKKKDGPQWSAFP
jgi:hypothetical protein